MAEARQARILSTWSETGAIEQAEQVDDWIAINPDGTVRVNSGKVELGTGVRTALAQIAAEELDVPLERIHMEMGHTGVTPDEGYTAGSKTIQFGGFSIRQASAEARRALLELASKRLDAPVEKLVVSDGVISVEGQPEQRASYQELAGGKKFNRKMTGSAPTKHPDDYRVVGTVVPRIELPGKFCGTGSYVHDLRLPGMLHGRVVRPPSPGSELVDVGKKQAGEVQVVRIGNFVGVVAEREFDAIRGARELPVQWKDARPIPEMTEMYSDILEQPTTDQEIVNQGDVARGLEAASHKLEASYYQPYQAHASIGPSCAVAELRDGVMTVWCSTQGVYPLRNALADLLQMPPDKVRVVHMEGAGCYGHNGADDVAADAVILAREAGRAVRVQWSREDEFAWEPYGPAMIMRLQGAVDDDGRVTAWSNEVRSPPHSSRGRAGIDLIAGQLIEGRSQPVRKFFVGGNRNAPTNYDFANQRIQMHWLDRLPLRTSSFRSLGAFANTFANESFLDELAAASAADPVQFRLNHLTDPRARKVVSAAARAASWGDVLPAGEGKGIAFARYENEEAYVATVAHVSVDEESGKIRVKRIVVAHDCGLIVNPNGLENQIEGNVIQSMSRALLERVTWEGSRVTSVDWMSYPIAKFSDVPEVKIVLINRPEERSVGAGEPATITTAPAIANAVYAGCGARLRRVPFLPEEVKAAMAAREQPEGRTQPAQ